MSDSLSSFYKDKNVLITGHTGFKGSWLALFLLSLGAKVSGLSLDPPRVPNHFTLIGLSKHLHDRRGDIRDREVLKDTFHECKPEIVFHLAAQPLVLESYENPHDTFEINVQGTVNVLEMIRETHTVRAAVLITTDKVYDNEEKDIPFQETDQLGAADPYSTSKAMCELLAATYQKSFFLKRDIGLATARAGNVLGGGDFAEHRLVPDTMKALFNSIPIYVRNPLAKRPWIHILDPLSGYLLLGAKLAKSPQEFSSPFNFGPIEEIPLTCQEIVEKIITLFGKGSWYSKKILNPPQEKATLRLSSRKAQALLDFKPLHTIHTALQDTLHWFQGYHETPEKKSLLDLSLHSLKPYLLAEKELSFQGAFS